METANTKENLWHFHRVFMSVDIGDDKKVSGPVMRRKNADGSWSYRHLTEKEWHDHVGYGRLCE